MLNRSSAHRSPMGRATPAAKNSQDHGYHRFKIYANSAWQRPPRNYKLAIFVFPFILLLAIFTSRIAPSPPLTFPFRAFGAECDAYLLPDANLSQLLQTTCSQPSAHGINDLNASLPVQFDVQDPQRNMIIVLDFWERMVNVQSAMRWLVSFAVDAGFTVAEPLMYESHVVPNYAFAEQFERKRMVPQTAALYFQTDSLYNTSHYISHHEFRRRTRGLEDISDAGRAIPVHHIDTAVFIDWDGKIMRSDSTSAFSWCDQILPKYARKTEYGWSFTKNVYFQRAMCITPKATLPPATLTSQLFADMFSFARDGTERKAKKCQDCVSLAFLNYRKHMFAGYTFNDENSKVSQSVLPVGKVPLHLADTIRREQMNDRPYVAIQIRTGKPFVLFKNYEKEQKKKTDHEPFRTWLKTCTSKLVAKAKEVAQDLGPDVAFYIASDMYNDGWKGGERCPWSVCSALEAAKVELARELRPLTWLKPDMLEIEQDVMGMCGLMDAAMCVKADRFVFSMPSNFGSWVRQQREMKKLRGQTFWVDCEDDRFGPH